MAIITPDYTYPHTIVNITDNSSRVATATAAPNGVSIFCPFLSPKGVANKMTTFTGTQEDFVNKFGIGSLADYGQPLLNAYNACSTEYVTLQCLRLMPVDAAYANVYVVVRYRVGEDDDGNTRIFIHFVEMSEETTDLKKVVIGGANGRTVSATVKLDPETFEESAEETAVEYKQFVLFSAAYKGRGQYGNNLSIRFDPATQADKSSAFKNYYVKFLDGTTVMTNLTTRVSFYEGAISGTENLFVEDAINDNENIDYVLYFNTTGYKALYDAYAAASLTGIESKVPYEKFDIINFTDASGVNASQIGNLADLARSLGFELESIPDVVGYGFKNGTDGSLVSDGVRVDPNKITEGSILEELYYDAFMGVASGNIKTTDQKPISDPDVEVMSRNKFPFRFTFDAGFPVKVKWAMTQLAAVRKDHVAILDAGIDLDGKSDAYDLFTTQFQLPSGQMTALSAINDWHCSYEAYMGKVKDPVTRRLVPVTSTYFLISALPLHHKTYGNWSIPYAGGTYGIINGYENNTLSVVYDDDIDATYMQKMYDNNINYAQITPKKEIIRATQNTMYSSSEALSELSNVLVTLDIKEEVEKIVYKYAYNFNRAADLARFNINLKALTERYASVVESISAEFDSTDEETEAGILHLYIGNRYYDLVKINLVDIEIN